MLLSRLEPPIADAPVLRDGAVSRRTWPSNIQPGNRALFEPDLARVIPATRRIELQDVSVTPGSAFFSGRQVLPASFSSPVVCEAFFRSPWRTARFLLVNHLVRRRRRLAGRCLAITDDWSSAYFHWITDALPRLFTVRDEARRLTLVLPYPHARIEFVRASLALFAIGGVEYVERGEVCVCERLVMPTHTSASGHYHEALLGELKGFIVDACGAGASGPRERLYVSRRQAAKRMVANEGEILAVLRRFDFRVVAFEALPFEDQVRLAASATHIVSSHGGGLTNILFMPPGSRVLELRRRGGQPRNCYFTLANAMGLDYHYQLCDPEKPGEDSHTGNVIVDPGRLEENLARICS